MAQRVADLKQGGKYQLKKAQYRLLDPDYSLLKGDQLEMIRLNIGTKGGLKLEECRPVKTPTISPKILGNKATGGKSVSENSSKRQAASTLKKHHDAMKSHQSELSAEESRAAELRELSERLNKQDKRIKTAAEAKIKTMEYKEKYPRYIQLDRFLKEKEAELLSLKEQYSAAENSGTKKSVGNQIYKFEKARNEEIQQTLHHYNILHTELAHLKEQLKLWEASQSAS